VNAVIGELYAFIGTVDNPCIDETHYVPGSNNEQCTGSLSARLPFEVVIEAETGLLLNRKQGIEQSLLRKWLYHFRRAILGGTLSFSIELGIVNQAAYAI